MCRVIINNDMVYSCGTDSTVTAWKVANDQLTYEFAHGGWVYDIVIGRDGTPLENRLVSISADGTCRLSNLETGAKIIAHKFDGACRSIAVDKAQTLVAVGNGDKNLTFIETTNYTKVKEVSLDCYVNSLAFNKRNDCLLAMTRDGWLHSLKF